MLDKKTESIKLINSIKMFEKETGEINTISSHSDNIDELIEYVLHVKLLLRRFEFSLGDKNMCDAYQFFMDNNVTDAMLVYLINNSIFDKVTCVANLLKTAQSMDLTNNKRISILKNYLEE